MPPPSQPQAEGPLVWESRDQIPQVCRSGLGQREERLGEPWRVWEGFLKEANCTRYRISDLGTKVDDDTDLQKAFSDTALRHSRPSISTFWLGSSHDHRPPTSFSNKLIPSSGPSLFLRPPRVASSNVAYPGGLP